MRAGSDTIIEKSAMIKDLIKRGLVASRAMRLAENLSDRKAVILMYHSVMDDPEAQRCTLGRIMHQTEVFRGQIEVIARHYDPVSMDDVLGFVRGEKELPQRAVAVTFDDGYLDNYEVAAPILERAGIPAAFYVTVDCIETGKLPWPSRLRFAFYTTQLREWKDEYGKAYPLSGDVQREKAYLRACDYCATLSGQVQECFVVALETELEIDPAKRPDGLMMNWDHVRSLVKRGHIVGSHTMTHPNMAHVPAECAHIELRESKRKLEEVLGFPTAHFSYPCPALAPHWKRNTIELCRQLGYLTAVTSNSGPVRRNDDPLSLHRAQPTKRVESLRWNVDCSFLGRAV
jgi:peptidoglycan/xylan/chitin deacetylase (PgdA/CDA1 family)